jgi:hypothetical protein
LIGAAGIGDFWRKSEMKTVEMRVRSAVLQAFGAALLVACAIGFKLGDSPAKSFILLFLYTFAAAIAWQVLFCDRTLSAFDRGFHRLALRVPIRYGLTLAVLTCVVIWYGPVVMKAGSFRLFAPVMVSAIVCLLSPRFPVGFGIVTIFCIAISSAIDSSRTNSSDHGVHWSSVLSDPEPLIFGSCVLCRMSLLVSIPVHFHRKGAWVAPTR